MNVEKMIKRDISVEIANYLTNNLPCYACYEKKILMMKKHMKQIFCIL